MDIDEYKMAWHNAWMTDLKLKQFFGCGRFEILVNETLY